MISTFIPFIGSTLRFIGNTPSTYPGPVFEEIQDAKADQPSIRFNSAQDAGDGCNGTIEVAFSC